MSAAEQAAGDARVARRTDAHLRALQSHTCASAVDTYTLASVEQDGRALRRAAVVGSTARVLYLAEDIEGLGAARRIRLAQLRGEQPPPGPGDAPAVAADPGDTSEWVVRVDPGASLGSVLGELLEVEGCADTDALVVVATRREQATGSVDLVLAAPPGTAAPGTRPGLGGGVLPLPFPLPADETDDDGEEAAAAVGMSAEATLTPAGSGPGAAPGARPLRAVPELPGSGILPGRTADRHRGRRPVSTSEPAGAASGGRPRRR